MNTDRELRFGPGMRVQRLVEAGFLLASIFTQDERLAYVTFALTVLQALSPRWVPIALAIAWLAPFRQEHRVGDLYFDAGGVRGASAISVVVQALALGLILAGFPTAGFLVLTFPAASFLMAPTLGFCAGCWFYVLGRDWLVRHGVIPGGSDEFRDIPIEGGSGHQPELPPAAQR